MPKPTEKRDTHPPEKEKPLYRQKLHADVAAVYDRRHDDLPHAKPIAESHFTLREDGSIASTLSSTIEPRPSAPPNLIFSNETPFVRLYQGNCFELLDAIHTKHPEGRFDCIFADPPYFLSNGGITCHAGKMVKVDKGDWDKSRGPELNHEFNYEWLKRCQQVLKPNGTI